MYKDARIVFIIDECHRTQFGEMHARIERYFNHKQYIGFTGTPIKETNKPAGGRLTSDLFGEELHTYHIGNAIKDNNVLGFSIEYHNTFKENEALNKLSETEKTDSKSIDLDEIYLNPERIKGVVNAIYNMHAKKTVDKNYTALFAVQSIQALILYYNEFKRHNDELEEQGKSDQKLRVSAIFTASDNGEEQLGTSSREALDNIMSDYTAEFGADCSDTDSFRRDLSNKLKAKVNPYIDIVIVVGIFLTGFDSPRTNTLYIDKNLEYHNLLQAFSRTNRVEKINKRFGNIVCFRNIRKNVNDALELFSSGSETLIAINKDFTICIKHLEKMAEELLAVTPKSLNVTSEDTPVEDQRKFIIAMRNFGMALTETKQFTEFNWKSHLEKILPENSYNTLVGELKTLNSRFREQPHKESILDYIDFCVELVGTDKIDYQYIQNLLNNIDLSSITGLKRGCERITELVEQSNNDTVRYKRELIRKFLEHLTDIYESGEIKDSYDVYKEFRKYVYKEKSNDIKEMEKETNVPEQQLREFLNQQEVLNDVENGELTDAVKENTPGMSFKERRNIVRKIKTWVVDTCKKIYASNIRLERNI